MVQLAPKCSYHLGIILLFNNKERVKGGEGKCGNYSSHFVYYEFIRIYENVASYNVRLGRADIISFILQLVCNRRIENH